MRYFERFVAKCTRHSERTADSTKDDKAARLLHALTFAVVHWLVLHCVVICCTSTPNYCNNRHE
jgi:hypothetical protein